MMKEKSAISWHSSIAKLSMQVIAGLGVAAALTAGSTSPANAYTDNSVTDANWSQIWSDEFNTGTQPNTNNWLISYYYEGFGDASYSSANSTIVNDGTNSFYRMQATNTPFTDQFGVTKSFTSGAANTHWSGTPFSFLYGQVVARMRLPAPNTGAGSWPALWMIRADLTSQDEIDNLENLGGSANYYTLHWGTSGSQQGSGAKVPALDPRGRWCQYITQWYSDHISWYIDVEDGNGPILQFQTNSAAQSGIPSHAMFLKLDEELGGWSGSTAGITNWPLNFDVDWVRVYQYAYPNQAPATPINLSTQSSTNSITVLWNASAGATSYKIYRSTTPGGEGTTPIASSIPGATYTDSSVTAATTYYYKVAAVNSFGTSAQSAETSCTPGLPPAPTGVSATPASGQVTLNWTASPGATTYNVYRGTTSGGESGTSLAFGITGTTYTDTSVVNGTAYYYTVGAQNTAGYSPWSSEVSATPSGSGTAPGAPTSLAASAGNGQATLNWTAGSGAVSYNVYRGTTSGGESATPVATNVTTMPYIDGSLTNGTTYYYKLKSVNGFGTSAYSNETSVTPTSGVTIPSAPTSLAATAGNAQIALTWTASSGATSYNVYRGTTAGGESATAIATGITTASYTNTGLTNGTAYYYKVKAVNSAGSSGYSNEANATPSAPTAPAAPTGLSATAGNAQVSLSWTASSGATSYNVYRGTTAGGESATAIATGITSTSYTNTGLTNGTAYFYKVKAVNGAGTSGYSNEASATPASGGSVPSAPTGVTATAGDSQVVVSWTAVSGATSYIVKWGPSGFGFVYSQSGVTGTTYTVTGLMNAIVSNFQVFAVNSAGTSSASSTINANPWPASGAPNSVTGLTATGGTGQVALTWTAVSGATSYKIFRGASTYMETLVASGVTSASYTNTGLATGTYYYRVEAVNGSGSSQISNEVNAHAN